jgi:hypothetical protein
MKRFFACSFSATRDEFSATRFHAPRGGVLQITKCSRSVRSNFLFSYCARTMMIGNSHGEIGEARVPS